MPERGGYRPPKNDAPVSQSREPQKFGRRHFLELAGAGLAGAVIGEQIFSDGKHGAREPAWPIKVSPSEPPDNLPMEPLPMEQNEIQRPREETNHEGVGVRGRGAHKKEKKKHKAHKEKRKKERRKKEEHELRDAPWANVIYDELWRQMNAVHNEKQRTELMKMVDMICHFEGQEVVRSRLHGDAHGAAARGYFRILLEKSDAYMRVLAEVAHQHGVPLSVMVDVFSIEGAGRQESKNRFQIGPDTARALGLEVDEEKKTDERTHLEKSAHAAARYLKTLHDAFGNQWGLALSAYNGGAMRVANLITHHFKGVRYTKTAHGPHFSPELLHKNTINAATLYEKEQMHLMKGDKTARAALRPLWYPFAAEALGRHGWKLVEEKQKKERERVARASK